MNANSTTQVITTLSWQRTGNINVTMTSPSQTYTESMMSKYQKTTYSTTVGSAQHVSPLGIHETVLTNNEFAELLKQKKPLQEFPKT